MASPIKVVRNRGLEKLFEESKKDDQNSIAAGVFFGLVVSNRVGINVTEEKDGKYKITAKPDVNWLSSQAVALRESILAIPLSATISADLSSRYTVAGVAGALIGSSMVEVVELDESNIMLPVNFGSWLNNHKLQKAIVSEMMMFCDVPGYRVTQRQPDVASVLLRVAPAPVEKPKTDSRREEIERKKKELEEQLRQLNESVFAGTDKDAGTGAGAAAPASATTPADTVGTYEYTLDADGFWGPPGGPAAKVRREDIDLNARKPVDMAADRAQYGHPPAPKRSVFGPGAGAGAGPPPRRGFGGMYN